jgi:hypothetical protein
MTESAGSYCWRAALAACLIFVGIGPAAAQQPQGITDAPPDPTFLSRFDFNMSAVKLAYPDQRFSWDTHWAGDFDLVDYVYGRASFLADYQALLGSEFRAFDPYQSSYTLEASGSVRSGKTEVLGVLSHVSRHLGDRFKHTAVAENSLGPRVMRRFTEGRSTIEFRGDLRKVIARVYVDYNWIIDADVTIRSDLNPRTGVYVRMFGQTIPTDQTIAGRDRQSGGRVEAGVLVGGTNGDLELFFGAERVVDADPLDRLPRHWAFAGFRLMRN